MSVKEIARRMHVGRLAVYGMLEQEIMPVIRLGRRWIITRVALMSKGSAPAACRLALDFRRSQR